MGWLFGWDTRRQLIDHLVNDNGLKTLKHCFRGNNMWAVHEGLTQEGTVTRFIVLYLIRHSRDGWGYKDMDESSGPYYYNCPLGYLDMVKDVEPIGYAKEWREKVRRYHAQPA